MYWESLKLLPSEDPMIEVFLSAMGEQRVQQVLPTPMFCILHNSLIVKFQKFLHTPKSTHIQEFTTWIECLRQTYKFMFKRKSGTTEFWVTHQPAIGFTGSTKRRYDTLFWMLSWSVCAHLQGGSLPWCHLLRRKTIHQCLNSLHSLDCLLLSVQCNLQRICLVGQRHNYVFLMLQTSGRLQALTKKRPSMKGQKKADYTSIPTRHLLGVTFCWELNFLWDIWHLILCMRYKPLKNGSSGQGL